jgi:hypothetical protein
LTFKCGRNQNVTWQFKSLDIWKNKITFSQNRKETKTERERDREREREKEKKEGN